MGLCAFLGRVSEGEPLPSLFQLLEAACLPWLLALLQPASGSLQPRLPLSHLLLCPFCLPPSLMRTLVMTSGPLWIMEGSPQSQVPQLNLIHKVPLPHEKSSFREGHQLLWKHGRFPGAPLPDITAETRARQTLNDSECHSLISHPGPGTGLGVLYMLSQSVLKIVP